MLNSLSANTGAVQIATDASFFNLVHDLIEAEKQRSADALSSSDHRSAERHAFACQQLLAPFRQRRLPSQAEFRPVLCQDLSPGGFAFFLSDRPDFDELIVALGQVPFQFFTAQVQNQTRTRVKRSLGYRIGCRFTGRIVSR